MTRYMEKTSRFELKSLSQANHFVEIGTLLLVSILGPVEVYISKYNLAFCSLIRRSFFSIEQTFQRTILQFLNGLINEIDNI